MTVSSPTCSLAIRTASGLCEQLIVKLDEVVVLEVGDDIVAKTGIENELIGAVSSGQDVIAGAAIHGVRAVAAIKLVIAGTAGQGVLAIAAGKLVIAGAAGQGVLAVAAIKLVIAGTAVQGVLAVAAHQTVHANAAVEQVVAVAARQAVITAAAVEHVVAVAAVESVVPGEAQDGVIAIPPVNHIVPCGACRDIVDVIGDCDQLTPDRASRELDGMDIEVERCVRSDRGRIQNVGEGVTQNGREVGDRNRVRRFPAAAHRPGAIRH